MSPLRALFSTEIFMPRGHEVLWTPALLILEAGANLTIAAAAVAVAWRLLRLRARPLPLRGRRALVLLGIFLAVAHLFDVWLIWAPLYWLDALVRCTTAAVAVAAAVTLAPNG
ncbi:MAG TPA: hypothetical protein VHM31_11745 [Polyangia bacterium]|nr:hypothetical protein [Polyangia bacterium]